MSEGTCRVLALVVGDDSVASTRFRVLAYVGPLSRRGISVEVRFEPRRPRSRLLDRVRRFRELMATTRTPDADILLVQRRTFPPVFARRLARTRVPRLFDFDDAIDSPPPRLVASRELRRKYRRNFEATIAVMDHVVCGSADLALRVPEGRRTVIPTPLDTSRYHPGAVRPPAAPTLGWVGHSDSLESLEALSEPLRELGIRHPDLRLIVVSDRPARLEGVKVEFRRWSRESEVSCFDGIGIGLNPLLDTPWNRAKCAFKLIQYMALGIPAVASPVGMNREVVEDGVNGLLAERPEDWIATIEGLLHDPERARRLAAHGRRTVATLYDVEVLAPRLAEALARTKRAARGLPASRQAGGAP